MIKMSVVIRTQKKTHEFIQIFQVAWWHTITMEIAVFCIKTPQELSQYKSEVQWNQNQISRT